MNYLSIDTTNKYLTVIGKNDDKYAIRFLNDCKMQHSTNLMIEIDSVMSELGLKPKDMDFFACSVGAGSFTGIRIGVSTIKAFCYAENKLAVKVTTFDALAYNVKRPKVMAVIDAKHSHYYVAGYENGEIILPPKFVLEAELKTYAKEFVLVSFEAIDGFSVEIVDVVEGLKVATEKNFEKFGLLDKEELEPLYIRSSSALERKTAKVEDREY